MFRVFSPLCFLIYGVKSRSGHDRSQSFVHSIEKIDDGSVLVDYPTQYEPYFHSLGLGWKLSSFNPIVDAAKIK